ncbi:hypothetical protein D3C80_1476660 [compost metagenome]
MIFYSRLWPSDGAFAALLAGGGARVTLLVLQPHIPLIPADAGIQCFGCTLSVWVCALVRFSIGDERVALAGSRRPPG